MDIVFRIEQADSPVARDLIAALDAEIRSRYPGEAVNGIDAASFEDNGGVFAVGYCDGKPTACGAFRPFENAAELKRMFVLPEFRRKGIARSMLRFLEETAAARGYKRAILETGKLQPEALSLYASSGWSRIAPFGQYVGTWYSVCFEKPLRP